MSSGGPELREEDIPSGSKPRGLSVPFPCFPQQAAKRVLPAERCGSAVFTDVVGQQPDGWAFIENLFDDFILLIVEWRFGDKDHPEAIPDWPVGSPTDCFRIDLVARLLNALSGKLKNVPEDPHLDRLLSEWNITTALAEQTATQA